MSDLGKTIRERDTLAQAMWDGLRILGFDIEDPTPAARLVSGYQSFAEAFIRDMHEQRRDHDEASEGYLEADELAAIVQRAREAAWDEGWYAGHDDIKRAIAEGLDGSRRATRNPYCAADDAHGASQGPGGAEVGTDG